MKLRECNPVSYLPESWEFWEGKQHYLIKGMIISPISLDWLMVTAYIMVVQVIDITQLEFRSLHRPDILILLTIFLMTF